MSLKRLSVTVGPVGRNMPGFSARISLNFDSGEGFTYDLARKFADPVSALLAAQALVEEEVAARGEPRGRAGYLGRQGD